MKKILSLMLIVCFLFNCGITSLHALDLNEISSEETLAEENAVIDEFLGDESLEHLFCNSTLPSDAIIEINSSTENIVSNILYDDEFNIDGYITIDNETVSITEYLNEIQSSRFDAIDLIYEEGLISEEERIKYYCQLFNDKKFENEECLFSVSMILQEYYERDDTSEEAKAMIEQVTAPPTYESVNNENLTINSNASEELNSIPSYNSRGIIHTINFEIYYDASINGIYDEALKLANWFEYVRSILVERDGFREPLTYPAVKYTVFLTSDSTGISGVTKAYNGGDNGENAYISYIVIYNFSTFNDSVKRTVFHEYFHAIQLSYYRDLENYWFYEATATWVSIIYAQDSSPYDGYINEFLQSKSPINSGKGYGAVLLPLTIYKAYGGTDTIRAIWERYGTVWSRTKKTELTFYELLYELDKALSIVGADFDDVFLTMAYYNFYPEIWYSSVHPKGKSYIENNWVQPLIAKPKGVAISGVNYSYESAVPLSSISNAYYEFDSQTVSQGAYGKLTLTVTFSGGTNAQYGVCQSYTIGSSQNHSHYDLIKTGTNKYIIVFEDYGSIQKTAGIIISNLSYGTISYSIDLRFDAE